MQKYITIDKIKLSVQHIWTYTDENCIKTLITYLSYKNIPVVEIYTKCKSITSLQIDIGTKEKLIKKLKLPYRKTKASSFFLYYRKGGYNKKIKTTKQLKLGNRNVLIVLKYIINEWAAIGINIKSLIFSRVTGGSGFNKTRVINYRRGV